MRVGNRKITDRELRHIGALHHAKSHRRQVKKWMRNVRECIAVANDAVLANKGEDEVARVLATMMPPQFAQRIARNQPPDLWMFWPIVTDAGLHRACAAVDEYAPTITVLEDFLGPFKSLLVRMFATESELLSEFALDHLWRVVPIPLHLATPEAYMPSSYGLGHVMPPSIRFNIQGVLTSMCSRTEEIAGIPFGAIDHHDIVESETHHAVARALQERFDRLQAAMSPKKKEDTWSTPESISKLVQAMLTKLDVAQAMLTKLDVDKATGKSWAFDLELGVPLLYVNPPYEKQHRADWIADLIKMNAITLEEARALMASGTLGSPNCRCVVSPLLVNDLHECKEKP